MTGSDIARRARTFRLLHDGPRAFVMPNPWDAGTARLVERAGFAAIATTSAGHAFSHGIPDGRASLDALLVHVAELAAATSLPLSVDLEDGFAATVDTLGSVVEAVAGAGAVGASIEDRDRSGELYPIGVAVERVEAFVAAARALSFPFTVTARCECFLAGQPDLDETIRRLRAYESAGADVVYAPGLASRDQIRAVVDAVESPVNVVAGLGGATPSVSELERLGVRRISLGSALARAGFGAVQRALDEVQTHGTFGFGADATPYAALNAAMAR
ncbi:isocitrate lyase/phosphoenolpyruvate mutase family protein [Microbacterium sp. HD4P20]|uniref:isocitrate lyase/PEP mutase family protein n=1 Tax=Microbacterium sp. HD4P20 TaxID=2864874 RepID=UPI001C6427E5|nr:isocitrate lyase/phosphoenolpyruvate mutase family protein [Microbacterium sp. HD4P20]MCP2636540.1 isocitrate lyase/phosphoenolpyruvate mutase family protein [Microbacterium sp. HD4P20]